MNTLSTSAESYKKSFWFAKAAVSAKRHFTGGSELLMPSLWHFSVIENKNKSMKTCNTFSDGLKWLNNYDKLHLLSFILHDVMTLLKRSTGPLSCSTTHVLPMYMTSNTPSPRSSRIGLTHLNTLRERCLIAHVDRHRQHGLIRVT